MRDEPTATTARSEVGPAFRGSAPVPGVLLAWAPPGAANRDRLALGSELVVGRSSSASFPFSDPKMSGRHARIRPFGDGFVVEDLGSSNGTYLDGTRLTGPQPARAGSVIRAGSAVLVLHPDLAEVQDHELPPSLAGRFHSPGTVRALGLARETGRHVLLAGESGTGKELCAAWLAEQLGGPWVTHNSARFASAEEAETTLFGVARGVFSGVDARPGLLERAEGGALFLDELHVMPLRVQQSLLRFAEDGIHTRIGSNEQRRLSVRLVMATNLPLDAPELAPDLVSRLFVVSLPPLEARRADVPEIFLRALADESAKLGLDATPLMSELRADYFEALCLAGYAGRNVRLLQEVAAELLAAWRLSTGAPEHALRDVFARRFDDSPVVLRHLPAETTDDSHYEQYRIRILAAYQAAQGNLSETERALKAEGLRVNRRWLAIFLRKWGIRAGRG
jgi:MoxR-like ATPase